MVGIVPPGLRRNGFCPGIDGAAVAFTTGLPFFGASTLVVPSTSTPGRRWTTSAGSRTNVQFVPIEWK